MPSGEATEGMDPVERADDLIHEIENMILASAASKGKPKSKKGEGDVRDRVEAMVREVGEPHAGFEVWQRDKVSAEDAEKFVEGLERLNVALERLDRPFFRLAVLFSDICGGDRGSQAVRLNTTDSVDEMVAKLQRQQADNGDVISAYSLHNQL